MESKYFVMEYVGGDKGTPVFVDGVVQEYVDQPWNDLLPEAENVYRQAEPLNFRAKHNLIDFDFCNTHSFFIASQSLVDWLTSQEINFIARPLTIWQGKKQTEKAYFLVRLKDRLWAMDRQRSAFQVAREADKSLRYSKVDPTQVAIKRVYQLVIDPAVASDSKMFYCQEAFRIIVVEALVSELEKYKGIKLTECCQYQFPGPATGEIDRG